ncbi:MAG: hypothetical protein NTX00_00975 [Candidatus Parcubacteria bacterium]|nr:hypothetical protein [Candidatus Parcubacteria bacterium]
MFGKKPEQKLPQAEAKPKFEPYEIHVMPTKFHKYLGVKRGGLGKIILIGLSILFVLGGTALGALYYLNLLGPKPAAQPVLNLNQPVNVNLNQNVNQANANANLNQNQNINANLNVNQNENLNVNLNANANANFNANLNLNQNINQNANLNLNTNVNAPSAQPVITYKSSLDSDSDGLTDVEEEIYGTEKRKPDTDGDGYLDGAEVINLFNPKVGGGALLETSGLVNKYSNPLFNYEILQPSIWLAKPNDESLREVIFQSSTGEYVEVLVADNPDKLDLVQWYLLESPAADLNQLQKETTKNGYQALISADHLNYYLIDTQNPDKVYVITYNIGDKKEVNFLTTFLMMKNSFKLISQPAGTVETQPQNPL